MDGFLADLEQAVAIMPELSLVYANRAAFWEKRGHLVLAIADYEKAIEIKAKSAAGRHAQARLEELKLNQQ